MNVEFRNNKVDNQLEAVNAEDTDGTGVRNSKLHTNQIIANGAISVEQFLSNPLGLKNAGGNQQKGISCRMVNRGEILRTLVNEKSGMFLLMTIMPQVHYLQGDAVLAHVSPGLFRKGWRVNRQA